MMNARTFVLASMAASAVALVACGGGGTVNVGSNDQQIVKKPDGGATGDGRTCSFDDAVWHDSATGDSGVTPKPDGEYVVGQTFGAPDGCNDCTCTTEGIACTTRACAPSDKPCADVWPPPPGCAPTICRYDGFDRRVGDRFRATDGCNTCTCAQDGTVSCTEMACLGCVPPREPAPNEVCTEAEVIAQNPYDGTCCTYGDSCSPPTGWKREKDAACP